MPLLRIALALALVFQVSAVWSQQTFPKSPIRFVVPYAPGGASDIIARALVEKMRESLGVAVVVDNRPGGSGIIGTASVAHATPDGYTIVLAGDQMVAADGVTKLPYDPEKDLEPLLIVTLAPMSVVVTANSPASTLKMLIDQARASPGTLGYASAGEQTIPNMAGELLKASSNVDLIHIPYKGGGPAIQDVAAGHVPIFVGTVASARPFVESGRVRVLATFSDRRLRATPDVPTLIELGFADLVVSSFTGIFVPAGTPASTKLVLQRAAATAMSDASFKAQMEKAGIEIAADTSSEFARHLVSDTARRMAQAFRSTAKK